MSKTQFESACFYVFFVWIGCKVPPTEKNTKLRGTGDRRRGLYPEKSKKTEKLLAEAGKVGNNEQVKTTGNPEKV